jgi:gluconolactonase
MDGKLPQILGQAGGPLVAGWNAPNRLIVGRDVQPGQRNQVAIFAANGPLSDPPPNYVWIRSATLDFYRPERFIATETVKFEVERHDPEIDRIIPKDACLEKLAGGFAFTEGPMWVPARVAGVASQPIDFGYLLFSDPNRNVIHRLTADGQLSIYRVKSGYKGLDISLYRQPGSNGLALDKDGRLTICEHGNRRVSRLEKNGVLTVLADRYEGKRLNSPNDLVYRSDGALYFTDPPFGLPKFHDDPRRELPFAGVFCLLNGQLKLVSTDLQGPNGVALSPDEKYLYVTNWDEKKKVVMRYAVNADGSLAEGTVFFDMTAAPGEEALDGVKVDERGHVFISGPGGVWIIGPDGRHLGTIRGPELPANFAWGDEDGRGLYMTARTGVYRLRVMP